MIEFFLEDFQRKKTMISDEVLRADPFSTTQERKPGTNQLPVFSFNSCTIAHSFNFWSIKTPFQKLQSLLSPLLCYTDTKESSFFVAEFFDNLDLNILRKPDGLATVFSCLDRF